MVNKCTCQGCFTNYYGHDSHSVFWLPKEENLRNVWIKFINRKDIDVASMKYIFVCEKHFEEKYLNRNKSRTRLINRMNPVPTLLSEYQYNLPISVLRGIKSNILEDERDKFLGMVRIKEHVWLKSCYAIW